MKTTIENLLNAKVINPSFTVRQCDRTKAVQSLRKMINTNRLHTINIKDRFYYRAAQYQQAFSDLSTQEAYAIKSLCY